MTVMEDAATRLEREHVHSVYEKIAPYFNDSRDKAWPKVRQFLLEHEPSSIIADVGCGNGKYLHVNGSVFKLGCDVCLPLVDSRCSCETFISLTNFKHQLSEQLTDRCSCT